MDNLKQLDGNLLGLEMCACALARTFQHRARMAVAGVASFQPGTGDIEIAPQSPGPVHVPVEGQRLCRKSAERLSGAHGLGCC